MPRAPADTSYPRWIDKDGANLRAVAPGLLVGNANAPGITAARSTVAIDLAGHVTRYPGLYLQHEAVLSMPFDDGSPFPVHVLPAAAGAALPVLRREGKVLVHCAAGLSRSASCAYAILRLLGIDHGEALRRVGTGDPRFPMAVTLDSARRWVEDRLVGQDAHRRRR